MFKRYDGNQRDIQFVFYFVDKMTPVLKKNLLRTER